jgi:hypothetical protein
LENNRTELRHTSQIVSIAPETADGKAEPEDPVPRKFENGAF